MQRIWAGLVVCLLAGAAFADVVVTRTGRVFWGRVVETDEHIEIHWPDAERGVVRLRHEDVRWVEREPAAPSVLEPPVRDLDLDLAHVRGLLEALQRAPDPLAEFTPSAPDALVLTELLSFAGLQYRLRIPAGWTLLAQERLHVFAGPPEADGFQPQLHVMRVPLPACGFLGENGLVSVVLGQGRGLADAFELLRLDVDPEGGLAVAEVQSKKQGRTVHSRKVFIAAGDEAYILASFDLPGAASRDAVLKASMASFERQ